MKKTNNILQFENLSQFESIVHGFSTRFFGDMRPSHHTYRQAIKKFSTALGIEEKNLVRMDQVHGNNVYLATKEDRATTIPETDGLISNSKEVFLGVITADCVPLLLYDPQKKQVAAIHAGWRGLFKEIIKTAIVDLIARGSDPRNIIAGIGPCIGACCYDIAREHADEFLAKFPDWKSFMTKRDGKIFFDLAGVASHQLQKLGVEEKHIEKADYCTFDHKDLYSCRRDGEGFSEIMGIIGQL